ncbi:MAG: PH domain-containing protein [Candidatus Binatia bacterium]|nr:PH domain-containing protein [Candidatus Binatia bacterium]
MTSPETTGTGPPEGAWQRISPLAVVFFMLRGLRALGSQFVYLIPPLFVARNQIGERLGAFLWLVALLPVLGTFWCGLVWLRYRYRVGPDRIEIRSGVLFRKQTHVPFDRIQNIHIEQPLYFRLFGYCSLRLDTAGSSQGEAHLVAIRLDRARELRANLLATKKPIRAPEEDLDEEREVVLNRRSLGDLTVHGLTNNRIWLFVGVLVPFLQRIGDAIPSYLKESGVDFQLPTSAMDQSRVALALTAVGFAVLVISGLLLFSIMGSILTYYGYTLSRAGGRYCCRAGLLTKKEFGMPTRRLQSIHYRQSWLDLVLGRVNLLLKQNSSGLPEPPGVEKSDQLLVPSVTPDEAWDLIADAMPDSAMRNIDFHAPSKRLINRYSLWAIWPALASVASVVIALPLVVSLGCLALAILVVVVSWLRWRRWGYAFDDEFIYIRRGLIGVEYLCFERYKLQQIGYASSPFLRRHRSLNLQFVLASESIYLPYVDRSTIAPLVDRSLYQVESSGRSWM